MKFSALILTGALFVTIPVTVFAQTPGTYTTVVTSPRTIATSSNSGAFRQDVQLDRQLLQSQIQAAKQAFQQKLQLIKDTRKQQIVTDINAKIPEINTAETNRMATAEAHLSTTLMRISSQAAALKSAGKNTATLDSAILAAQTALSGAQTAISTQAEKQYTLTITSDTTLRQTIQPTILQFRQDLINTQTTLKNARLTVIKAYQALIAVQTGTKAVPPLPPVGTSSAKQLQ